LNQINNPRKRKIVREEHSLQARKSLNQVIPSISRYTIRVYDDFVAAGHGGCDPSISDPKASDGTFLCDSTLQFKAKSNVLLAGRSMGGCNLKRCLYAIEKSDTGLRIPASFFSLA
jgi:hypothetical protein